MPNNEHKKAAQHHDDAAKAHRTAADAHEKGDHETGAQHSQVANDHSGKAHERQRTLMKNRSQLRKHNLAHSVVKVALQAGRICPLFCARS